MSADSAWWGKKDAHHRNEHESRSSDAFPGLGEPFKVYPTTKCFVCRGIPRKDTAELLYVSSLWDYYYCYKCRGWFKKYFADERIVVQIKDESMSKRLTWAYLQDMQITYEQKKVGKTIHSVWTNLGRYLSRVHGTRPGGGDDNTRSVG